MPDQSDHLPFKTLILFNLLILSFLILSTRLATVLHEAAGHGLAALLSGGKVYSISVSLFGGGFTRADLGENAFLIQFLFSLSGIFINLITGALPLFFIKRMERANLFASLFLAIFSLTSLSGAISYLILGIYYQSGDPVTWAAAPPGWFLTLWIFLLPVAPVISFFTLKPYLFVQERIFPSPSFSRRLVVCFVTFGVSGIVYSLLFFSTQQSLASANAPAAAYSRAQAEVIAQKRQTFMAQLRKIHPQFTDEEIEHLAGKTVIAVDPAEVPQKPPMTPMLAALFLAGGWIALKRQPTGGEAKTASIGTYKILGVALLSAAVLALLIWTNGYIYRVATDHLP